ncbi:hypothetical protein M9H77_14224 [Catharanthus roseus]|uniref:Uncharacterized protein n=1 Tax=Catharanthus roseus TaxID=4058 RepID=A0ACC0BML9_CATRO|nr:hypothetical protein M9H77_14224 [Catharanthus roseus]
MGSASIVTPSSSLSVTSGPEAYHEGDSYYKVGQIGMKAWNVYEQEARYYRMETYESQERMKSFLYEEKFANNIDNVHRIVLSPLSRQKEARKACAQKKVRFEEQP